MEDEAYFSRRDGLRIAEAVRKIEQILLRNKNVPRHFGIEGEIVELQDDLTHGESVTAKICVADTEEPYTLSAGDTEITLWEWGIPEGKKLPADSQCLAFFIGGKYRSFVIDKCLVSE